MLFQEYDESAEFTRIYPSKYYVLYPAMGLAGESGEILNKLKKVLRDDQGDFDSKSDTWYNDIASELGDCLWYISALAEDLGMSLDYIAEMNLKKLRDRKERGVLGGSGDKR